MSAHLHPLGTEGVVLPADVELYEEHALELDGTPTQPIVLAHALKVTEARYRGR
jgi:hypothetical protein